MGNGNQKDGGAVVGTGAGTGTGTGTGTGSSKKKEQNIQEAIQEQQKVQERSEKYEPFAEQEIARLKQRFQELSGGKNGISVDELKNYIELKTHFFRERIYQIVETDMKNRGKTEIDFDFFIKLLTPFHPLLSSDVKYKLLFDIYDLNGDELISQEDIQGTMKIIYSIQIASNKAEEEGGEQKRRNQEIEETKEAFMANPEYLESLAKDIMNDFDKDRSGELDFEEFKILVDNLDLQFRLNINF